MKRLFPSKSSTKDELIAKTTYNQLFSAGSVESFVESSAKRDPIAKGEVEVKKSRGVDADEIVDEKRTARMNLHKKANHPSGKVHHHYLLQSSGVGSQKILILLLDLVLSLAKQTLQL